MKSALSLNNHLKLETIFALIILVICFLFLLLLMLFQIFLQKPCYIFFRFLLPLIRYFPCFRLHLEYFSFCSMKYPFSQTFCHNTTYYLHSNALLLAKFAFQCCLNDYYLVSFFVYFSIYLQPFVIQIYVTFV